MASLSRGRSALPPLRIECAHSLQGDPERYFHTSRAMSTVMASLAHCCSSVSTLPSSVLAKPH